MDQVYCYFGHHKCGSGWIRSIIRDVCNRAGWKKVTIYDAEVAAPGQSLANYLQGKNTDFFCYTNADFDRVLELGSCRGFHVVRDPRDIIVSAYFSHLHSHTVIGWPELIPHRDKLKSLSKDEGLMLEMEFSKPFLDLMGKWDYGKPDILEIRMEELTVNPVEGFLEIFDFLGVLKDAEPGLTERLLMTINPLNQKGRGRMPFGWPLSPIRVPLEHIPASTVRKVVDTYSFSRLSGGRKPGEENATSHYRKGLAGDWVNHFKPEHVGRFEEMYGGLLEKLGYE